MSIWYRQGTVNIVNGATAVTGILTTWNNQAKPGDMFSADGGEKWYEIKSIGGNTSIELETPFQEMNVAGGAYAIARVAPGWHEVPPLGLKLAQYLDSQRAFLSGNGSPSDSLGADGSVYIDAANKVFWGPKAAGIWAGTSVPIVGINAGSIFAYDDATGMADPDEGNFRFNHLTWGSITAGAFSVTSAEGQELLASIMSWGLSTNDTRGRLRFTKVGDPESWAEFLITAAVVDNSTWAQIALEHVGHGGTWTAADRFVVAFSQAGDPGVHAGYVFAFESSTVMGAPASGGWRIDHATAATATAAAISATSALGQAILARLLSWGDSTNPVRGTLKFEKVGDPTVWIEVDVTGVVDNTTWVQVNFTYVGAGGSRVAGDQFVLAFGRSGDVGATGAVSAASSLDLTHIPTPGAPGAGVLRVFAKSDNEIYTQTPAGVEKKIGGGSVSYGLANHSLAVSAAGNALTIALKDAAGNDPSAASPVIGNFRNVTPATGSWTQLSVTSALSLTVSSGSTLGVTSSRAFRLWVVLFNDGGSPRLGVINCASPTAIFPLVEGNVASSTAEGGAGAADSAGVFYTGTAVTSKAYLIVGYVEWNASGLTAGTWTTTNLLYVQSFGPGIKKPGDTVQMSLTTTTTGVSSHTSTSYATALSASITPTSAANRIRVAVSGTQRSGPNANPVNATLFRGTTAGTKIASRALANTNAGDTFTTAALNALDAPNTISSQAYTAGIASDGTRNVFMFHTGDTASYGEMILEEIMT